MRDGDGRDTPAERQPPDQPWLPTGWSLVCPLFFPTDSLLEQQEQSTSAVRVLGRTSRLTANGPGGTSCALLRTVPALCEAPEPASPTLPAEAGPGPQLGEPPSTRPRARDGATCAPSTSQPLRQQATGETSLRYFISPRVPWRRARQPTPAFSPRESCAQTRPGATVRGGTESDTMEAHTGARA